VLLFSSDQLAAFLPSIRQRAAAFLPAGDPNADALKTLPDPTQPAHQSVAARVQAQAAPQAGPTVPQAVLPAVPQTAPTVLQAALAVPQPPAPAQANNPPRGGQGAQPNGDPNGSRQPAAADTDTASASDAASTTDTASASDAASAMETVGTTDTAATPDAAGTTDTAGTPVAGDGQSPRGNQNAGQPPPPSPDGTVTPPPPPPPPGGIVLTGMLGADQQVAAQVLNAACRAEDQQQLQVRHFRGVLYGASAVLLAVVAVIWVAGAIHPAYFPLCWPVSGTHPAMICPTNGTAPSAGDVPLVLGMGALGATLSVALNLAGLKPAGVHFSLTVAQGLNKMVLGAITAVLGIIILRTVTNAPGFLGTQPGLLTTAVVFGYSQQVFTRLIDRQADQLMNAASPATPPAG
jgi:hypothetical protein